MAENKTGIYYQTYKLRPTVHGKLSLRAFFGTVRFIWNRMLQYNVYRYLEHGEVLTYKEMLAIMKLWKQSEEYGFINTIEYHAQYQVVRDLSFWLNRHLKKGEGRSGYFPFKNKTQPPAVRFQHRYFIHDDTLFIQKLGYFHLIKHREINGEIQHIHLVEKPSGWYVHVAISRETANKIHPTNDSVGIDVGLAHHAVLSDNIAFDLPDCSDIDCKLKKALKHLNRKQRGSSNWLKQLHIVKRLREQRKNRIADAQHKWTRHITREYKTVVIEDLNIKQLKRSAFSKHPVFGRRISKSRWVEFGTYLQYKSQEEGGQLLRVNPSYTSQTCPQCGYVDKINRRSQSRFVCHNCGFEGNADWIAAINILRRGTS